jgi:hypothetical protein
VTKPKTGDWVLAVWRNADGTVRETKKTRVLDADHPALGTGLILDLPSARHLVAYPDDRAAQTRKWPLCYCRVDSQPRTRWSALPGC